ncbi:MAG: cbb3-type cytochrome c oxidase subunit 3 [Bdellovibrionales bacterium]|nr:cbb3-type cytochrome c oxidase subunit 3 [Bdellovibrionales bacterium]
MKQDGLAFFTDTHLTALGLVIFFGFFIGVLIWTSLKENKANYQKMEKIPLIDGDN